MQYTDKSLLLVANPSNYHVYNYIKNILVPAGIRVTVYSINGPVKDLKEEYKSYYDQQSIKLVDGIQIVSVLNPRYIDYIIKSVKRIKSLGHFDYLHEFYMLHLIAPVLYLSRKQFIRITLTFFGSDLYRVKGTKRLLLQPLLNCAHHITLITSDMYNYFVNNPPQNKRLQQKCKIIDVGNMFYGTIDKIRAADNKTSLKKQFGFDEEKLVVSIGYMGRKEMQQYETIQSILSMDVNLISRIQLAIPAYRISDSEYDRIKRLLDESPLKNDYIIFTHFMGENEVSSFRIMTDIFIHAQTSDALSNAMMEHLYAGSVVVNGEWLNYSSLDDNGIDYIKFKDFRNLGGVLTNVINNFFSLSQAAIKNHDIVYSISSWDALRSKWLSNYD